MSFIAECRSNPTGKNRSKPAGACISGAGASFDLQFNVGVQANKCVQWLESRSAMSALHMPFLWSFPHLHGALAVRTMKGAATVTLAQLVDAGVIEPGEQVLTVSVGGPGGTNTFIAGGAPVSAMADVYQAVQDQSCSLRRCDLQRMPRVLHAGLRAMMPWADQQCTLTVSEWHRLRRMSHELAFHAAETALAVQICWRTGTSSTTASCSRARHRGACTSSG